MSSYSSYPRAVTCSAQFAEPRQRDLVFVLGFAVVAPLRPDRSEAATSFSFFEDFESRRIFAASDAAFLPVAMVASQNIFFGRFYRLEVIVCPYAEIDKEHRPIGKRE